MRRLIQILLLSLLPLLSFSQNSNIGAKNLKVTKKSRFLQDVTIGSSSFDASAILGITSTTKGILIPRMNTTQRDNIGSPSTGLMIFNTTTNQFEFFETTWQAIGAGGNTIYSADDNLAGNRIVTMGANSLTFSGNLTTFKGIDATSANFSLKVQDNVGTELFNVRNDGRTSLNHSTPLSDLHIATTVANAGLTMYRQGEGVTDRFQLFLGNGTGGFNANQTYYWALNSFHHFGSGASTFDERFEITGTGISSFKSAIFYGNELSFPDNVGLTLSKATGETERFHMMVGTGTTIGGRLYESNRTYFETNNNNLHFRDLNTGIHSISLISTGEVGINNITPSAKLAVNGSVVSNTYNFAADAQADDDYEIAIPDLVALTTGLMVTFTANTANTGGATLEITSVGLLDAILKLHDQALATGDIEAGQVVVCVFDGISWQMISQLAQ